MFMESCPLSVMLPSLPGLQQNQSLGRLSLQELISSIISLTGAVGVERCRLIWKPLKIDYARLWAEGL